MTPLDEMKRQTVIDDADLRIKAVLNVEDRETEELIDAIATAVALRLDKRIRQILRD